MLTTRQLQDVAKQIQNTIVYEREKLKGQFNNWNPFNSTFSTNELDKALIQLDMVMQLMKISDYIDKKALEERQAKERAKEEIVETEEPIEGINFPFEEEVKEDGPKND